MGFDFLGFDFMWKKKTFGFWIGNINNYYDFNRNLFGVHYCTGFLIHILYFEFRIGNHNGS